MDLHAKYRGRLRLQKNQNLQTSADKTRETDIGSSGLQQVSAETPETDVGSGGSHQVPTTKVQANDTSRQRQVQTDGFSDGLRPVNKNGEKSKKQKNKICADEGEEHLAPSSPEKQARPMSPTRVTPALGRPPLNIPADRYVGPGVSRPMQNHAPESSTGRSLEDGVDWTTFQRSSRPTDVERTVSRSDQNVAGAGSSLRAVGDESVVNPLGRGSDTGSQCATFDSRYMSDSDRSPSTERDIAPESNASTEHTLVPSPSSTRSPSPASNPEPTRSALEMSPRNYQLEVNTLIAATKAAVGDVESLAERLRGEDMLRRIRQITKDAVDTMSMTLRSELKSEIARSVLKPQIDETVKNALESRLPDTKAFVEVRALLDATETSLASLRKWCEVQDDKASTLWRVAGEKFNKLSDRADLIEQNQTSLITNNGILEKKITGLEKKVADTDHENKQLQQTILRAEQNLKQAIDRIDELERRAHAAPVPGYNSRDRRPSPAREHQRRDEYQRRHDDELRRENDERRRRDDGERRRRDDGERRRRDDDERQRRDGRDRYSSRDDYSSRSGGYGGYSGYR
ncbi:hypothetical protein LTR86_005447 [Recurvomyces mirabilis]|nr:hypothetical protein LTR86_005447 [Recurvomyces mirabilis]